MGFKVQQLAKEGINVALTYYDWEERLAELQQDITVSSFQPFADSISKVISIECEYS